MQWINWDRASEDDLFDEGNEFKDVFNYSIGGEYRIGVAEGTSLFPRAGIRFYKAPWKDHDDLPRVGAQQLMIEPDDEEFIIFSFGGGLLDHPGRQGAQPQHRVRRRGGCPQHRIRLHHGVLGVV
jgi:hypothetical protein